MSKSKSGSEKSDLSGKRWASSVTISDNVSRQGIELYFDNEPHPELQSKLRVLGFLPSKIVGMWYAKTSPKAQGFADELKIVLPMTPGGPAMIIKPSYEPSRANIENKRFSFVLISERNGQDKSYIVFEPSKPRAEVLAANFAHKMFGESYQDLSVTPKSKMREARMLFEEGRIIQETTQEESSYKVAAINLERLEPGEEEEVRQPDTLQVTIGGKNANLSSILHEFHTWLKDHPEHKGSTKIGKPVFSQWVSANHQEVTERDASTLWDRHQRLVKIINRIGKLDTKQIVVEPYSSILKKLTKIIPGLMEHLQSGEHFSGKSHVEGYMDLHFDFLFKDKQGYNIALAHYYEMNGDLVPDPDMQIRIIPEMNAAEAMTFQNMYRYDEVYHHQDGKEMVDQKMKPKLNSYLNEWLSTLISYGHQVQLVKESVNDSIQADEPEENPIQNTEFENTSVDRFEKIPVPMPTETYKVTLLIVSNSVNDYRGGFFMEQEFSHPSSWEQKPTQSQAAFKTRAEAIEENLATIIGLCLFEAEPHERSVDSKEYLKAKLETTLEAIYKFGEEHGYNRKELLFKSKAPLFNIDVALAVPVPDLKSEGPASGILHRITEKAHDDIIQLLQSKGCEVFYYDAKAWRLKTGNLQRVPGLDTQVAKYYKNVYQQSPEYQSDIKLPQPVNSETSSSKLADDSEITHVKIGNVQPIPNIQLDVTKLPEATTIKISYPVFDAIGMALKYANTRVFAYEGKVWVTTSNSAGDALMKEVPELTSKYSSGLTAAQPAFVETIDELKEEPLADDEGNYTAETSGNAMETIAVPMPDNCFEVTISLIQTSFRDYRAGTFTRKLFGNNYSENTGVNVHGIPYSTRKEALHESIIQAGKIISISEVAKGEDANSKPSTCLAQSLHALFEFAEKEGLKQPEMVLKMVAIPYEIDFTKVVPIPLLRFDRKNRPDSYRITQGMFNRFERMFQVKGAEVFYYDEKAWVVMSKPLGIMRVPELDKEVKRYFKKEYKNSQEYEHIQELLEEKNDKSKLLYKRLLRLIPSLLTYLGKDGKGSINHKGEFQEREIVCFFRKGQSEIFICEDLDGHQELQTSVVIYPTEERAEVVSEWLSDWYAERYDRLDKECDREGDDMAIGRDMTRGFSEWLEEILDERIVIAIEPTVHEQSLEFLNEPVSKQSTSGNLEFNPYAVAIHISQEHDLIEEWRLAYKADPIPRRREFTKEEIQRLKEFYNTYIIENAEAEQSYKNLHDSLSDDSFTLVETLPSPEKQQEFNSSSTYSPEEEKAILKKFEDLGFKAPFTVKEALDRKLPVIDVCFRYYDTEEYFRETYERPLKAKIRKLDADSKTKNGKVKTRTKEDQAIQSQIAELSQKLALAEKAYQDEFLLFQDNFVVYVLEMAKRAGHSPANKQQLSDFQVFVTESVFDGRTIENYPREPITKVVEELITDYFSADKTAASAKSDKRPSVRVVDIIRYDTLAPNVIVPAGTSEPFITGDFSLYDVKETIKTKFPHLRKLTNKALTTATPLEMFELVQMSHPTDYGVKVDRQAMLEEWERRGKKLFIDLGFPVDPDYPYVNINTGYDSVEPLNQILFEHNTEGNQWWSVADRCRPVADLEQALVFIDSQIETVERSMTEKVNPKNNKPHGSQKDQHRQLQFTLRDFKESRKVVADYLAKHRAQHPLTLVPENGAGDPDSTMPVYINDAVAVPGAKLASHTDQSLSKRLISEKAYGILSEKLRIADSDILFYQGGAFTVLKLEDEAFLLERPEMEQAATNYFEHTFKTSAEFKKREKNRIKDFKKDLEGAEWKDHYNRDEIDRIILNGIVYHRVRLMACVLEGFRYLYVSDQMYLVNLLHEIYNQRPKLEYQDAFGKADPGIRAVAGSYVKDTILDNDFITSNDQYPALKYVWNALLSTINPAKGAGTKKTPAAETNDSKSEDNEENPDSHFPELKAAYWQTSDEKYPVSKMSLNGTEFHSARLRHALYGLLAKLPLDGQRLIAGEIAKNFPTGMTVEEVGKSLVTIGKTGAKREISIIESFIDRAVNYYDLNNDSDRPVLNYLVDALKIKRPVASVGTKSMLEGWVLFEEDVKIPLTSDNGCFTRITLARTVEMNYRMSVSCWLYENDGNLLSDPPVSKDGKVFELRIEALREGLIKIKTYLTGLLQAIETGGNKGKRKQASVGKVLDELDRHASRNFIDINAETVSPVAKDYPELAGAMWNAEDEKYMDGKVIIEGQAYNGAKLINTLQNLIKKLPFKRRMELVDKAAERFFPRKPIEEYQREALAAGDKYFIGTFFFDLFHDYDLKDGSDFPLTKLLIAGLFKQEDLVDAVTPEKPALRKINKNDQHQLNKQIEALIDEKDAKGESFSLEEKDLIRQYAGSGGLLKQGAKGRGVLYEYYTPDWLVEQMWVLARRFGYDGGSVLEPSVGTGNFLKYAPENAVVFGFETNHYSARIAQVLYPHAHIHEKAFETLFFAGNVHLKDKIDHPLYSLVIGNPPYGEFTGKYAGMGEKKWTGALEYDQYFMLRGLDLLQPGGLIVFLVPSLFMQSAQKYNKTKEKIFQKAEVLKCFRLPQSLFSATDIGTDIIILKRRGGNTSTEDKTKPSGIDHEKLPIIKAKHGYVCDKTGLYIHRGEEMFHDEKNALFFKALKIKDVHSRNDLEQNNPWLPGVIKEMFENYMKKNGHRNELHEKYYSEDAIYDPAQVVEAGLEYVYEAMRDEGVSSCWLHKIDITEAFAD